MRLAVGAPSNGALQALFDIFADHGLGQATFEIVPGQPTRLWIKHKAPVGSDRSRIAEALARAGNLPAHRLSRPAAARHTIRTAAA